jgi:hypothetical protein
MPAGINRTGSRGGNASVMVAAESFERVSALAPRLAAETKRPLGPVANGYKRGRESVASSAYQPRTPTAHIRSLRSSRRLATARLYTFTKTKMSISLFWTARRASHTGTKRLTPQLAKSLASAGVSLTPGVMLRLLLFIRWRWFHPVVVRRHCGSSPSEVTSTQRPLRRSSMFALSDHHCCRGRSVAGPARFPYSSQEA